MKSFFEFYEKIKNKKMNEQDAMVPPNMGMNQGGMGGMPSAGGMGGMGGMGGGGMGDMSQGGPPMGAMPDMSGGMGGMGGSPDASMDMGGDDDDRSQVAPPAHKLNDDQAIDMMKALKKFAKTLEVDEDDDEKKNARSELMSQISAAMNNLATLTGQDVSDEDEDDTEEGGEDEAPSSPDMIPPNTQTPYGGEFGNPAGGGGNEFPSNGGGSGDMGGNMAGGSAPGTTGPGALGFGGGMAG